MCKNIPESLDRLCSVIPITGELVPMIANSLKDNDDHDTSLTSLLYSFLLHCRKL
jgi:hypothetical protein